MLTALVPPPHNSLFTPMLIFAILEKDGEKFPPQDHLLSVYSLLSTATSFADIKISIISGAPIFSIDDIEIFPTSAIFIDWAIPRHGWSLAFITHWPHAFGTSQLHRLFELSFESRHFRAMRVASLCRAVYR